MKNFLRNLFFLLLFSPALYAQHTNSFGNGSLSQNYVVQNLCGLNFTSSSVQTSTRPASLGTGFPTILNIGGLPPGFVIQKAYVYFGASYTEPVAPHASVLITNPAATSNTISSTLIDSASAVCWGETGTATYRTDVTSMISGNGNYKINVNNFSNPDSEIDGVTLFILYVDPSATYSGNIAIWDGNIADNTGSAIDVTETGVSACIGSVHCSAFGIYGDIESNKNGGFNTDVFNGTTQTFSNNFWQTNVINNTANVTACQSTFDFNSYTNNSGDCYLIAALGIYWQYNSCSACAAIFDTASQVNPSCGGNNGSATITITGGTPPYTYSWSPVTQSGSTATGLTAGTYTVTANDAGCNVITATYTLTSTNGATVTGIVDSNVSCYGGSNGSANVNAIGGTTPYTYSWSPSADSTDSVSGLSAGTYSVIVTDANGCTGSTTLVITQPPALTAIASSTSATCGFSNGTVFVSAGGGVTPYTYSWSISGQTTTTVSGLSAGIYTLSITDSNHCNILVNDTVLGVSSVAIMVNFVNPVLCNGQTNGSISITAGGGTSPYTYSWSPSNDSTALVSNLSAGTYTVNVTDNFGCSGSDTIVITQPIALKDSITSLTNIVCNGDSNGTASFGVSGGTKPYTYSWTDGETTDTATALSAGSYTVTISDGNGCSVSDTVSITQPPPFTINVFVMTTRCGQSTGSAFANVSGGLSPYAYSWSPGGSSNAFVSGLSSGIYTVTVTDARGCSQTGEATITAVSSMVVNINNLGRIKCYGDLTGELSVTADSGIAPYSYHWSPGNQSTDTISNLKAGTYIVLVTDAHGCSSADTIIITQPAPLNASISNLNNITCHGFNNGNAAVAASGGTSPYIYLWSNGTTTSSISNLSAGTYSVIVTDSDSCTYPNSIIINDPPLLGGTISSITATCQGNNGSAIFIVSGGVSPYNYSWSPGGQSTPTAINLSGGLYTVFVTDHNGCMFSDTITVGTTGMTSISVTGTNILCHGDSIGTASVTVIGGAMPYTYSWNPTADTTSSISGLSAGTYTVSVSDASGCTLTASVNITQPTAVSAYTLSTQAFCGQSDGSLTAVPSGGTTPYTYSWIPGGATTTTLSGLSAGTYSVSITDGNGCSIIATGEVSNSFMTGKDTVLSNDKCFGELNGSASVTIFGGTPPLTYLWTPSTQTSATASGLSAGTYSVSVTDSNGCMFLGTVIITQPASALDETSVISNSYCSSSDNGSINMSVSGGTSPFTYSWSNGSTVQTLSNLAPGIYSFKITDANGCTDISSDTIGTDYTIIANAGRDTSLCQNNSCTLNASASQNAVAYTWYMMPARDSIGNTPTLTITPPIGTTTYLLVVQNGPCSDSSTVKITVTTAVFANAGPTQSIFGTGSVTIGGNPTGPSGSTYYWNPGSFLNDSTLANPLASPTVTTIYTVLVTTSAGCSASDTVTVFVYPGFIIPTGFTPNADGVNDYWVLPFGDLLPNIDVEVYNRWGEKMFSSSGYAIPWDGIYNGKALPVGTYYYVIIPNDPKFPNSYTGTVTIMR